MTTPPEKDDLKQAVEEAFERTVVLPLNGRYDEKRRIPDFAMFSLGFRQAIAKIREQEAVIKGEKS